MAFAAHAAAPKSRQSSPIGRGPGSATSARRRPATAALVEDIAKLGGIVEMDETYVGGSDKNRHWDKKSHRTGRGAGGKTPVIGAVKRKGNVIARVVNNVSRQVIDQFVNSAISSKVSLLCTDSFATYDHLKHDYPARRR
jgi:hypothetical protein